MAARHNFTVILILHNSISYQPNFCPSVNYFIYYQLRNTYLPNKSIPLHYLSSHYLSYWEKHIHKRTLSKNSFLKRKITAIFLHSLPTTYSPISSKRYLPIPTTFARINAWITAVMPPCPGRPCFLPGRGGALCMCSVAQLQKRGVSKYSVPPEFCWRGRTPRGVNYWFWARRGGARQTGR